MSLQNQVQIPYQKDIIMEEIKETPILPNIPYIYKENPNKGKKFSLIKTIKSKIPSKNTVFYTVHNGKENTRRVMNNIVIKMKNKKVEQKVEEEYNMVYEINSNTLIGYDIIQL